jgi:hypothetical protein
VPAKVDDLQTTRGLLQRVVVVPLNVEVLQVCGENLPAWAGASVTTSCVSTVSTTVLIIAALLHSLMSVTYCLPALAKLLDIPEPQPLRSAAPAWSV